MRIDFTKMHGVGNDFVVFDAPADESVLRPELLRSLADRRTGTGFDPRSLPFEAPREADSYPLEVAGRTLDIGAVSIGNPHALITVASVEAAPVATLGPQIERHPRFPKRVNAGFVEIVARTQVRL